MQTYRQKYLGLEHVGSVLEVLHERWLPGCFPLTLGHFNIIMCSLGAVSELGLTYNSRLVSPDAEK